MLDWLFTKKDAHSSGIPKEEKKKDRIQLNSLPEEVWENPWYPLNGPPKNPQEAELLQKVIEEEQSAVKAALSKRHDEMRNEKKLLDTHAKSNCADLQYDWKICLSTFNFDRFTTLCHGQQIAFENCVKIQTRNLEKLQYYKFLHTYPEKIDELVEKADQMYLDEMELLKNPPPKN
ncbi:hypothetical protein BC833DRAFT_275890 [Globomyces pollinis-pini]|nr:hypothetical protein BC833DRAFT_275890 [Globomyces pollinis-pini]